MQTIKKFWYHLKRVCIHKYWVCKYCFQLGIPWRGIKHDLSKFSWAEFSRGVKYYTPNGSPIPEEKRLNNGVSIAWQHHKGRNSHHYEYWTDNYDSGTTCIQMPFEDAVEMICDYLGAARAYWGKAFTFNKEYDWWLTKVDKIKMHPHTKGFVSAVLHTLKDEDARVSLNMYFNKHYLRYLYRSIESELYN